MRIRFLQFDIEVPSTPGMRACGIVGALQPEPGLENNGNGRYVYTPAGRYIDLQN